MSNKTVITLDSFTANCSSDENKGTFEADPCTLTLVGPDGETMLEAMVEPRVYKSGGVGFFCNIPASGGVKYKGKVPLSGNLRLSIPGLKLSGPSDKVSFK